MKLISDENVPHLINEYLRTKDVDLVSVKELGLSRSPDNIITEEAHRLERVILTFDLGFTRLRNISGTTKYGLIIIRHKGKIPQNLFKIIDKFLEKYKDSDFIRKIVVIDSHKFRVRDIPM
ncbi:MAG: DUF5615 family PIN-like protein [Candidatus Woykebacteria bacterium]